MKLTSFTLVSLLSSCLALSAMAQETTIPKDKPGYDYQYSPKNGTEKSTEEGSQFRFNNRNTAGWPLMSQKERKAYHTKTMSAKTFEECTTIQSEHRTLMEKRAQDSGVPFRSPSQNACKRMNERGMFK